MRIDILTTFTEMFPAVLGASILGRAADKGILDFKLHDIREYSENKHHNTDDYPFGGGAGMVMLAQPIYSCLSTTPPSPTHGPTPIRIAVSASSPYIRSMPICASCRSWKTKKHISMRQTREPRSSCSLQAPVKDSIWQTSISSYNLSIYIDIVVL